MNIEIRYRKFPETLLPGWYWEISGVDYNGLSGPYKTMYNVLKDVCRELRYLVKVEGVK